MDILKYCSELDSIMSESPKKKKLLKESSVKKPAKNSQKNRRINENYGNDGYMYLTKHGLGPGTLPKDVHLLKAKDLPHYMTAIWLDRFLTTDELKKFDIYPETEIRRVMDFYDISEKDLLGEAYVNPETGKSINNVYGMTNIEKEIDFDSDSNLDFSEITKHRFLTDESLTEDEEVEYVKKYGREMVPDGTHRISYYEFEQPKHPKDWHLGQRNRREISADEYNELAFGVKKQKNEALKEKSLKELTRKEMYSKAFDSISKSIEKTGGINFWDMNEIMNMVNKWNDAHPDEREIEIYEGDDYVQIDDEPIYVNQLVSESCKTKKNHKKSLKEKLVDAPQEVVDELLRILERHGFILDDSIKHENPIRTWMGAIHIQVINPDSFIDEDGDVGYQLKKYVTEELIDEIQALEDRSDCPITWNFGPNANDQVTGGLDVNKQWIEDEVNESLGRPKNKKPQTLIEGCKTMRYTNKKNRRHLKESYSIKEQALELLEDRINDVFATIQDQEGIEYGDIDPLTSLELDEATDKLAAIIEKAIILEKNSEYDDLEESFKRNKRPLKEAKDRWVQTPYGFKELNYKGITITDYKDCETMFMPYRYTVDYYGDEAGFDSLDDAKKDIDEFLNEYENN